MKKDVIYIDIEDDITAVIDKLKASKEKIIAMVPPKGSAVLQSIVNLKLLQRAADSVGKQPVIVTNNQALTALAGGLGLYVAKNLQSKPAVPVVGAAIAAIESDDSVEVSDELGALDETPAAQTVSDESELELSGEELEALQGTQESTPDKKPKSGSKKDGKDKKKVPNFNSFRKKLLIGGGIALVLAIALLFIFGRAKASIVIRAETTPVDIAFDATVNPGAASSDPASYNLKPQVEEAKKTISQTFAATGQKDIGQKASGTVTMSNPVDSDSVSVPAGTTATSSTGKAFITNTSVTIPGASVKGGRIVAGTASVGVTAAESGDGYNVGPTSYTIAGRPGLTAQGAQMSGGTTQVVKVVTQEDIDKAKQQIQQQDASVTKEELKKKFGDNVTVLDDSFTTSMGAISSEPAAGQQANEGKLSAEVTYSLKALKNDDLNASLDTFITSQMTAKDQQQVFDNGFKSLKIEKVNETTYKITALGQYGPRFDTGKLQQEVAGKKYGEIRAQLQALPGVKGVDIKLTPFWARQAPNASRIQIKLEVDKNVSG